jgi:hypothetical protein
MARRVHDWPLVVAVGPLVSMLASCVFPPPLELDSPDAAPNSPPTLIEVRDNAANVVPLPGPLVVQADDPRQLTFTLSDNDRGDLLFVNLYVDYNFPNPSPALDSCVAPVPVTGMQRGATCNALSRLCPADIDTSIQHLMTALISDRALDPAGEPIYQAVTAPGYGMPYTWVLTCEAASP